MTVRLLTVLLLLTLSVPTVAQTPTPTPVLEGRDVPIGADKKPAAWDVEGDHGPSTLVEFETDEGTWMSLDVSRDGRWIVFDMLGDIYRMPIGGGRAELISGGASYEVQPRFSPDGSTIAFTSDRDGGDNIWLMNPDGTNRRQLTKETVRLLNTPSWSPDGNYLLARKHFVDTRSLGAGEIWMYHKNGGGTGVQLTERPNWTANSGEPVMDPQGRFVYFVNSTAFDYNKNVYDSIYWIERYDMNKGRRNTFIRGSGGAVRPMLSPDGKLLSFIRRVDGNSVLFLREIASGREWPIYAGVTRDQQETWAIFGTFPGYAWTPDGRSIVVTAGGKFIRVDVGTGRATPIPFMARVSQRVTQPVRFKQNVLPDRDTAKLLRWARRSGDRIVFQALGKIYEKRGNGEPRRLMNTSYLEYAPRFSADGRRMTYVTWSDAEKGAVWIADADGSDARRITTVPDQYANPVFSSDGAKVAFLKGRGTVFHEEDLASESSFEIHYWDGKATNFVTDVLSRGSNNKMPILNFDPAGERIFYMESPPVPASSPTAPANIVSFVSSVKLSGDDYRRHVEAKFASEIVPSPDMQWIAFKELHKVYLAPFPQTGRTVKLSATEAIVPIRNLSQKSGDWLTWSADSRTVAWTYGENFNEVRLDDVFRQPSGSSISDVPPAPTPAGTRIGFEFETAKPGGNVALTNARIITMKGDEVIPRGTVLIENNRIKAVGATVAVPAGTRQIDMQGRTITPGFVDVHAHMGYNTLDISPEKQWPYYANLAYGVTTTHDPSASTQLVFSQAEMVKAGVMVGPRIFSTGYILYGAEGAEKAVVNNLEDAQRHVERMKSVGAISVKSYNQPRRNQRQQIVKATRDQQMMNVPEGGSTYYFNMTHVLDGHTGIEHAIPVAPLYKDALTLLARSGVGYTPTLIVGYGGLWGENYWYQNTEVWKNQKLLRFTPRGVLDARSRRRPMAAEDDHYHFELARTARDVVRAGGKVQNGAHGQIQGIGVHWELWMMVQGGMTPIEAWRASTIDGARYLGLDGDVGSIEPGKLADLVVFDKDPLANIRNSESIKYVMANGVLFDAETMNEEYPQRRMRGRFFWEHEQPKQ